MNSIRWQRPKWLPRLLSMPVPEPAQQASRILAIQRNIILPAKLMVAGVVLYHLFYARGLDLGLTNEPSPWEIFLKTLQEYFIFYLIFNAIAAILLILRRFPPGLVQWVVFSVGLVDGLLLAGLTVETGGFGSTLYWVFPGLIVINALSIPLATPQIVLNLLLSVFYLGAGLAEVSITDSANIYQSPDWQFGSQKFSTRDIVNLDSLATRLKQPPDSDLVSKFLDTQLSAASRNLLSNYHGGANLQLQQALVEDLNQIIQSGPIYDQQRFAQAHLPPEISKQAEQKVQGTALTRLNRRLLLEAYPAEISKNRQWMKDLKSIAERPVSETAPAETGTEPFLLRLIILWLMTAACYGVQLLAFRQKVSEEEERKSTARNDELKAAGRLAAEIAHQLKNPLGIINNAAFSLQRGLKEGRNDFSQQIEIIREEVERSDRIITQLMGYAQLSEGRVEKLNLREELERAILEVFPPGASYATQIHRDFGNSLPMFLMQRSHLSVVLVNLLQNAREALNGGGNIEIHAHYGDAGTVQIVISDDGPGIAADKLDKVFEAYYTSKAKGTGLGLAIVKHNVELYGGAVRVESELGKGARFVLIFPAKTFIMTGS